MLSRLQSQLRDLASALMILCVSVFDVTEHTPTDVSMALSAMIQVFETQQERPGIPDLNYWLDSNMTSETELELLKNMITFFPTLITLFQKMKVDLVLTSMTEEDLGEVCMQMMSPVTPTTVTAVIFKFFPHCAIFYSRQAQQHGLNLTIPLVMFPKSDIIYQRLRDIRNLLFTDFLIDPSKITSADIDNVPETLFREPINLHILHRILRYLRREIREQLARSLLAANGPPVTWTNTTMNFVGNYVMFLPQTDINRYVNDEVLEMLLERVDTVVHESVAWLMVSTLYEKRHTKHFVRRLCTALYYHTYATVTVLHQFELEELFDTLKKVQDVQSKACLDYRSAGMDPYMVNTIQADTTNPCMMARERNMMLISPLLGKLFPKEAPVVSFLDLVEIAMFVPYAPDYILGKLESEDLYKAWPVLQVSGVEYSLTKLRIIYEKIKDYFPVPENMQTDHMRLLGPLLLVLRCESIHAIPDNILTQLVLEGYVKRGANLKCDDNPEICWIFVSKALNGASADMMSSVVTNLGPMGRYVRLEDLDDRVYYNSHFHERVIREMHQRAVYQRYQPDAIDETDMIEKSMQVATNEYTIINLPEDGIGLDLLMNVQHVMQVMAKSTRKPLKISLLDIGYSYLRRLYGLHDDARNVCIAEVVATSLACFFTRASKADLAKLSADSQKMVFLAIGRNEYCASSMLPQQTRALFQALIDADAELAESQTWTSDMVRKHGLALFCGMRRNDVYKLSSQSISQFGHYLCQCAQLGTETRKALFDRILQIFQGNMDSLMSSPYNIRLIDSCLMFATGSQLFSMSTASKKLLVSVTSTIMTVMWDRLKWLKETSHTLVDFLTEKAAVKVLADNIQRIMNDLNMSKSDQISQVVKFQEFLSIDVISNLTSEEFAVAVHYMRDNGHWSIEQTVVFKTKITQTFGDFSTWTRLDFLHLKKLLRFVFSDGFGMVKANLDNCTLKSIFAYLRDDVHAVKQLCNEVSSLWLVELIKKYPEFLCCLEVKQMEALEPEIVVQVVLTVEGPCYPCLVQRKELLEIMAAKFAEYLRSENITDEIMLGSFYRDIKCISGVLPTPILLALPPSTIVNFDADAIKLMKPDIFCQLASSEVLTALNTDQRFALKDKIECLNSRQLVTLQDILEASDRTDVDYIEELIPDFTITDIGDTSKLAALMINISSLFTQRSGVQQCRLFIEHRVISLTNDCLLNLRQQMGTRLIMVMESILSRTDTDVSTFSAMDLEQLLNKLPINNITQTDLILNFVQDIPDLLQQDTQESFERLNNTLTQVNPRLYTLFKPHIMCEPLKKLKQNQLAILCKRLLLKDVSTQSFIIFSTRCSVCITFMDAQRIRTEIHGTLDRNKGAVFYTILINSKKSLDLYHLALAPEALTSDVINMVPVSHFKDIAQLSVISNQKFYGIASEQIQKLISEKIFKALGSVNNWTELFIYRLRHYAFMMDRKIIRETYQPGLLMETLTSVDARMSGLSAIASNRNIIGQILNLYSLNMTLNVPRDILLMPQLLCLQLTSGLPKILLKPSTSLYSSNFLLQMAETCPQFYYIPHYSSKSYIRRVIAVNDHSSATLLGLREVIGHMTRRDIQNFPKLAWLRVLPYIAEKPLDYMQLWNIWDIIKEDYQAARIACDQIKTLGRLIKVWTESYISQIAENEITGCISSIAELFTNDEPQNLPKPFARALWAKVKSYVVADMSTINSSFDAKMVIFIPRDELKSLSFDVINKTILNQISEHIKGSHLAKLLNLHLNMCLSDDQRFLMTNEKIAEAALTFYPENDITMLEDGEAMGIMLEMLSESASHITARSIEVGFQLLKKRIGLDNSCKEQTVCLLEYQARTLGSLFFVARPAELKCLTKTTQRFIFEMIGSQPTLCRKLPRAVIRNMLVMAQDIVSADPQAKILDFGCLMCGHTASQIQDMTEDQVDSIHAILSKCPHLDHYTAKLVVDKTLRHNGGFQGYIVNNPDLSFGPLVRHVSPYDITSLPPVEKEILTANIGNIARMISQENHDHLIRTRRWEISDNEIKLKKNMTNQVLTAIYTVATELYNSDKQWRNKRSESDDEMCSLLEEFDGNLCFLTLEDINHLTDLVVRDCAPQFQSCDYDSNILEVLASKAKNAMETRIDQWKITDFAELGRFVGLMGNESITHMVLNDDVMAALPLNTLIPNGDLLMMQYLNHNEFSLRQLSAEQISDYALLLGQLSLENLNLLEPEVVCDAALLNDLGSQPLEKLPFEKVQLFTNKMIESAKIDFKTTDTSDTEHLGPLAGALPEKILLSMTSNQKRGLTPAAISIIPGEVLARTFTTDDFKSLISEQANMITPNQKIMLSSQQRAALSTRVTVTLEDKHDSGSHIQPLCLRDVVLISLAAGVFYLCRFCCL